MDNFISTSEIVILYNHTDSYVGILTQIYTHILLSVKPDVNLYRKRQLDIGMFW